MAELADAALRLVGARLLTVALLVVAVLFAGGLSVVLDGTVALFAGAVLAVLGVLAGLAVVAVRR